MYRTPTADLDIVRVGGTRELRIHLLPWNTIELEEHALNKLLCSTQIAPTLVLWEPLAQILVLELPLKEIRLVEEDDDRSVLCRRTGANSATLQHAQSHKLKEHWQSRSMRTVVKAMNRHKPGRVCGCKSHQTGSRTPSFDLCLHPPTNSAQRGQW